MTVLVALMGPAGSGKSTVAAHLVDTRAAEVHSLAKPLKMIAGLALGFSEKQLFGTQAEKECPDERYGFSGRWLLQRLGTEGFRAVYGQDVWTRVLVRNVLVRSRPAFAVVDDARFANESDLLRDPSTLRARGSDRVLGALLEVARLTFEGTPHAEPPGFAHALVGAVSDVLGSDFAEALPPPVAGDRGLVIKLHPPADEEAAARAAGAGQHSSETEWLSAACDVAITPSFRGVPALLKAVDTALATLGVAAPAPTAPIPTALAPESAP